MTRKQAAAYMAGVGVGLAIGTIGPPFGLPGFTYTAFGLFLVTVAYVVEKSINDEDDA